MSDTHDPTPRPPEPGTPPSEPVSRSTAPEFLEDSSSQALSEALRSSFRIVKFVMALLVLVFLCSGVFVVQPNEVAVILRFGKPVGHKLLLPGWHWAWPYPIDQPIRIRRELSQTVTSTTGWPALAPGATEPQPLGYLNPAFGGYTLSADEDIIHVRAHIKYRVTDPIRFVFHFYANSFTNIPALLTNIVNDAIINASAHFSAVNALYSNKLAFTETVLSNVQQRVNAVNLGITLEPSDVETMVPVDVKRAFAAVTEAEQEQSTAINNANAYSNEIVLKAIGESNSVVNSALVSSNKLVSAVEGFATNFTEQLPYYQAHPHLFTQWLFADRMERILTNAEDKFYQPERIQELRLLLNRAPMGNPPPSSSSSSSSP